MSVVKVFSDRYKGYKIPHPEKRKEKKKKKKERMISFTRTHVNYR